MGTTKERLASRAKRDRDLKALRRRIENGEATKTELLALIDRFVIARSRSLSLRDSNRELKERLDAA